MFRILKLVKNGRRQKLYIYFFSKSLLFWSQINEFSNFLFFPFTFFSIEGESIGFLKNAYFRLLVDLYVLKGPKLDLNIFRKCLFVSVCV